MADIQKTYADALESLIARVREDTCVVAAVLAGSLAYDTVWERSDIDLLLVTEESKQQKTSLCLVEDGVIVHCILIPRSRFRQLVEGAIQGSFMHSFLSKGRMLFSRDPVLVELFESRPAMGERDRSLQLMRVLSELLPGLTKAVKWLRVKRDYDYCCHWILRCVDALASIELLLRWEVPTREVVQRAVALNPELFDAVYTRLLHEPPGHQCLEAALDRVRAYLLANVETLCGPVLEYLRSEGQVRSITEINHHFEHNMNLEGADNICEWLSDEGLIQRFGAPVRLTTRSRVSLEEAAYYYTEDAEPWP